MAVLTVKRLYLQTARYKAGKIGPDVSIFEISFPTGWDLTFIRHCRLSVRMT